MDQAQEPVDDSVITAIAAALEAAPANIALRVHLAELLLAAKRSTEALRQAEIGLAVQPANIAFLMVAARAARGLQLVEQAEGYEVLLQALGSAKPVPPPGAPVQNPLAQRATSVPDSADDLLEYWDGVDPHPEPIVGELVRPSLRLVDVAGMVEVKKRLQTSFLAPMQNPDLRAAFGKSMRGGLLLWGPPGCGKTFIAKAVAGELGASFYHVGLADILDMWIGSSERNLAAVFDTARHNSPCVLFLDEIDALGQKRTNLRSGGASLRGVVNQLLEEMDGASTNNDGVFVLAATNHPWDIDPALLRPGRLDRTLLVVPPDSEAREAIFELHLRNRPVDRLDLRRAAIGTEGLTGADIALICEQATEYALMDSIESGAVRPITMEDLLKSMQTVKPSYGPWLETARNFAVYSNASGQYDDLLTWLRTRKRR